MSTCDDLDYKSAETVLEAVARKTSAVRRYRRYWKSITPKTDDEAFRRWVFAYATVQTGWQQSVKIYTRLFEPGVKWTETGLDRVLRSVGAGIYQVRSRGLAEFRRSFEADPSWWRPTPDESYAEARDRMVGALTGLGFAKTSFALEMLSPEDSDVICVDRHLLKLYKVSAVKPAPAVLRAIEDHWRRECRRLRTPCPLARHIWWDSIRVPARTNTRYWSYVFES